MTASGANGARPVTEDELHAYVDGQLSAERRAEVARWLAEHPAEARRVAEDTEIREALRSALGGPANEPVPPALDLRLVVQQRLMQRRQVWRAAAAILLAFGVGGGAGWLLHGTSGPTPGMLAVLAREAVANHVVYTADRRRPTELGAEQRDDLARWVSNRLKHSVAPPDLTDAGFTYIGGRLAATPQGPAGLFMYQNTAGIRLTVFVLPMGTAANRQPEAVDVGKMDGYAWIDKGIGYTVVAPVPQEELRSLADQVRRQISSAA